MPGLRFAPNEIGYDVNLPSLGYSERRSLSGIPRPISNAYLFKQSWSRCYGNDDVTWRYFQRFKVVALYQFNPVGIGRSLKLESS